jgi:tetratricopeptide (TPR) repeat protein
MMAARKSILLILFIGLITACQSQESPASIPTGTPTPIPTQTATPAPTNTPTPTATSTPTARELAEVDFLEGVALQEEDEWDLAIKAYSEAIAIDPDYAEAYINRGLCFYFANDPEVAISNFENALELDYEPQTPQMYVNRGRAHSILEEIEAAIDDFGKALELDPEFIEAYVRRGNIYAWIMNDFDLAFPDFESAIAIDPEYALIYQKRGYAYILQGEYESAIEDLNLAIDLDLQDSANYYYRGLAYFNLDETDKAIFDFSEALDLNPQDAWAYYFRGLSYAIQGNFDLGIDDLNASLEIDPKFAYAHYFLGFMYDDSLEPEMAIYHLEIGVELGLDPDDEEYALSLLDELTSLQAAQVDLNPNWLVTVEEVTALTDEFEIGYWEVIDEVVWDFRVCTAFNGQSWSTSPNLAVNCTFTLAPGVSLDGAIDSLFEDGILSAEATLIEPKSVYEGESALFAEMDENGHSYFIAIRIEDGLLYLASLSLGTPLGSSPISVYESAGELIDAYLIDVFEINLEKRRTISVETMPDDVARIFGGETSQGEEFTFRVEGGAITALQIGFDIPGCESWSPYSQLNVNYLIDENTISIIDTNLEITGAFDSPDSASGIMSIHPAICDGEVDVTWSVSTDYVPPPPDIPEGSFPDMAIPEDLFNPKKGDDDFYHPGIASQGDWILYASVMESILPVPSGWFIDETGNQTNILFFQKGDRDEPSIFIRLGIIPDFDGGTDPSVQTISEISDNLNALDVHQILATEMIDKDKGYILVNLNHNSETSEMMLLFTSRYLNNPSGAFTHVFSAYTSPENWDDYYPIVREMLIHWVATDYGPLGDKLPESLMD